MTRPTWRTMGVTGRIVLLFALALPSVLGIQWLRDHAAIALNETDSLPHVAYWVWKDTLPQRGDYVLFQPPAHVKSPYNFVKQVVGTVGDTITIHDHGVFINDTPFGVIKTRSQRGVPLSPIATGVIPDGFFFVHAPHKDSYDSRYAQIGLVPEHRIIGRAFPLF